MKQQQTTGHRFDSVSFVMDYEAGELDDDAIVDGFRELVRTGLAWQLQGHYGRTAAAMIEAGMIEDPRARH